MKHIKNKISALLLSSPLSLLCNACLYGAPPIYIGCSTSDECRQDDDLKKYYSRDELKEFHCMDGYCTDCNTVESCEAVKYEREHRYDAYSDASSDK